MLGEVMKTWLLDVTDGSGGMPCFCPYEESTGTIMIGLHVIADKCPGELIGVFHEGGEDAAEKWCCDNPDWHERYA